MQEEGQIDALQTQARRTRTHALDSDCSPILPSLRLQLHPTEPQAAAPRVSCRAPAVTQAEKEEQEEQEKNGEQKEEERADEDEGVDMTNDFEVSPNRNPNPNRSPSRSPSPSPSSFPDY